MQCCCLSINNICKFTTLKVQCRSRYRLLKLWQSNAYKNVSYGLQRATSWVCDITNPDKPHPQEHAAKGAEPCCAALKKRKSSCHAFKTRGARKNLIIYESQFCLLVILIFQNQCFNQQFFNPVPHCSASLSDHQLHQ